MQPVRIGCSGWNYDDWRGGLYPEGLGRARWLERYAEVFDTVEVNSTFYRLASRDAVARWVEQTPRGFLFAAKASRYLTHVRRLRDVAEGVERYYERIEPLIGAGRLGPLVWQFPATFRRCDPGGEDLLGRVARLLELVPAGRHCFEFRHAELVRARALRVAAVPQCRARDRRPSEVALPGPRADRRLDARAPPSRPARAAGQLFRDRA